jgi:hypothetical protein
MTRAEEYLVRAAECEEQAAKLADHPRIRADYLGLARLWRAMAEETDNPEAEAKGRAANRGY